MRRILAALLVLIAIAVGFVLFSDFGTDPQGPTEIEEEVVGDGGLEAGSFDPGTRTAARSDDEEEPFDPRGEKVGAGQYGMFGTVVDEGGQPVPNAWVAAYSMPFPLMDFEFQMEEILEAPLELSLEPLASVFADEEGHFSLEGLFGRTTYLVARAPKQLTRGRQLIEAADLDSEEGVLLHTVVGAALSGIVRDEQGRPVADAELFVLPSPLYMIQAFRNRDIYIERVYTDGAGRFSIDAVPAGAMLMALAFDGATHPGMREVGPLSREVSAETEISLMQTGSLSGRVVDEEGEAVSGVKLVAVPLDFRLALPFIRDLSSWITESGSDGGWEFPQLPERQYMVIAQGREGRSPLYSNRVTGPGSMALEDIVLRSKVKMTGRVIDRQGSPISGAKVALKSIPTKQDSGGSMRRGMPDAASIFREILEEVAPELLPVETFAVTGGNGSFTLAAWQGARLEVDAPDYPKAVFRANFEEGKTPLLVMMRPGAIEGKVIDRDGQPVRFFVVSGNQRNSALDPAVEVERLEDEDRNVFRDRRDQAREEARDALMGGIAGDDEVLLMPEMPALANLRNLRFQDDGTGRFELQGLMPGEWRVEARAEGFVVGESTAVTVEEGETSKGVEITLSRGSTIRGVVLAQGTREPVAGAVVTVGRGKESGFQAYLQMGFDTTAIARSEVDGSFELRGVDTGMKWVHALCEGFAPVSVEIEPLVEDEVREGLVLEVSLGGGIEGHVYDRNGNPLPGRMVAGMAPDSQDFWQAPTNEDGYYHAEHVRPGNYFVVTAALDDDALFTGDLLSVLGGTRLAQAFVRDGETATVDIEDLAAGGCKLSGRVMSGGEPVRNAAMFAMATETSGIFDFRIATARTDDQGEFKFGEMAPGEYRLQVESGDWDGAIEFFVDDIPEDYQVLEAPRGVVRGKVVHEQTGQPVEGASVTLVRDDGSGGLLSGFFGGGMGGEWETTDERGEYEFDGVSPGEYHIEAQMNRFGRLEQVDAEPLGRAETRRFDVGENDSRRMDDIALPIAATLSVVVTTAGGESFERGFSITAERADGEGEPMSGWGWNGQGSVTGLEAGKWTVTVQAEGYAAVIRDGIEVRTGEDTQVEVALRRGGTLRVRLLQASGQPLVGADVRVLDAQGRQVNKGFNSFAAAFGGADATIPVGTFEPGSYKVEVEWQGTTRERRVSLSEGSEELLEFNF